MREAYKGRGIAAPHSTRGHPVSVNWLLKRTGKDLTRPYRGFAYSTAQEGEKGGRPCNEEWGRRPLQQGLGCVPNPNGCLEKRGGRASGGKSGRSLYVQRNRTVSVILFWAEKKNYL